MQDIMTQFIIQGGCLPGLNGLNLHKEKIRQSQNSCHVGGGGDLAKIIQDMNLRDLTNTPGTNLAGVDLYLG